MGRGPGRCWSAPGGARGVEPFDAASGGARRWWPSRTVKPGQLYQPIRVAITGTTVSPGIFESLGCAGPRARPLRIDAAL